MTVIRGGTIVDGTGKAGFVGDVVVEGDKIVDVTLNSQLPTP